MRTTGLEWVSDALCWHVECSDGLSYDVRPINPDDGPALRAFHHRLSQRTTYLRFFTFHPELSDVEVARFTNVDQEGRVALVAEEAGNLIAVGRFERLAGATAEVAFVVADDHQRHGIGSLLLDLLVDAARQRGVDSFVAETLAENSPMLAVVYHSGFPVTSRRDHESVTLEFPIGPSAAYDEARRARRSHMTVSARWTAATGPVLKTVTTSSSANGEPRRVEGGGPR